MLFTVPSRFISITLAYEYMEMEMQFDEIMVIVLRCALIVAAPKCVVWLYKYV